MSRNRLEWCGGFTRTNARVKGAARNSSVILSLKRSCGVWGSARVALHSRPLSAHLFFVNRTLPRKFADGSASVRLDRQALPPAEFPGHELATNNRIHRLVEAPFDHRPPGTSVKLMLSPSNAYVRSRTRGNAELVQRQRGEHLERHPNTIR